MQKKNNKMLQTTPSPEFVTEFGFSDILIKYTTVHQPGYFFSSSQQQLGFYITTNDDQA